VQRRPLRRSSDVTKGWQALADKRLAHLVELFETGRWRRYHTQADFLENLREAKSAVDTWSILSGGEVAPDRLEHEESSPKYRNALPNASFVLDAARLAAGGND
jgi:uncharacterized repeat protein (TIGR03809 family)